MRGAVAHGVDVGQARLAAKIDEHAVRGDGAGGGERLDGRVDADAHDDELGGDRLAALQAHAAHATGALGALLQLDDLRAETDVDAMRAVLGLEESRERLAGDACEDARLGLEHRDVLALLAKHRGGLEADVPAAHHDDLVCHLELGDHAVDVEAVSHGVDAGEVVTAAGEPPRLAARRPHQRAVADGSSVGEPHLVGDRVHGDDALSETDLDLLLFPVRRGTEEQRVEGLVAGEVLLRERRTLVRKERLRADHEDGALAGTDDHDVCSRSHRPRLYPKTAVRSLLGRGPCASSFPSARHDCRGSAPGSFRERRRGAKRAPHRSRHDDHGSFPGSARWASC